MKSGSSGLPEGCIITGPRCRKILVLRSVVLVLTIAGPVKGGVDRTMHARAKQKIATVPTSTPAPINQVRYANTGLAALQWTNLNATLHKRVYYQDHSKKIRQSAWDDSTTCDTVWQVNTISGAFKSGTPVTAAAGYPQASYNYSLVNHIQPSVFDISFDIS